MGVHPGEDEEAPFTELLNHTLGYPTQRDATVAAEFITWLGTNAGNSYLIQSRQLSEHLIKHKAQGDSHAYLMQWTITNKRLCYVNGGVRTMEWWFMRDQDQDHLWGGARGIPELTARDVEVVETIAYWLGTPAGQTFIQECERETKEIRRYRDRVMSAYMNEEVSKQETCVSGPEIALLLHMKRHLLSGSSALEDNT